MLTNISEHDNLTIVYMTNAVMRNSTQGLEHRELLVDEKQWKESVELASEHLPKIFLDRKE